MTLLPNKIPSNGTVAPAENEDVYLFPASFGQQRLWFLHELAPRSPAYNIIRAFRLQGPLDISALAGSLDEMTGRHETLRTAFGLVDDEPVQIIYAHLPFQFSDRPDGRESQPFINLEALPAEERESAVYSYLDREAHRPFDLTRPSLLRVSLLRLDQAEHVLCFNIHHIIADGWSMNLFFDELAARYDFLSGCHTNGSRPSLPELTIQYADFAEWQRDQWQSDAAAEAMAYWQQQLAGPLPLLELPVDYPRPGTPAFEGARYPITLSDSLVNALQEIGRQANATLFMTLLAAFQTLLFRCSGQADIIVGSPVAGRSQSGLDPLIGFFVNTLPFRSRLDGRQSFGQLLEQVRQVALEAYAHQDIPLEKVVEAVQPQRQWSDAPLPQVVLALQNEAPTTLRLAGLTAAPLPVESRTAKFDLTLSLAPGRAGLEGWLEYDTVLFKEETIARLAGHWLTLLESVAANPEQRLANIPLLTAAERRQILIEWNNTAGSYPHQAAIHELVEAQAATTPEANALVFQGERLTYRQVNERANQLAHHLLALGVGVEEPVGLFLERSLEMVIATLGILKAGAAYLPLDLAYPPERLAFMLADTRSRIVLTMAHLRPLLNDLAAAPAAICLDSDWPEIGRHRQDNPARAISPLNLAYIMYTSGSTGEPKGVSVPHRSVVRLVKNSNYLPFSAQEVFLQYAPVSFDAATLELWGSLLNGACLVIAPPQALSLVELGRVIREERVTTLWLTSGLFHLMVAEQLEDLDGLRYLLAGGDVLSPAHVRRALTGLPNGRLINGYGPTENTTFTACYPMDSTAQVGQSVPIGRPIANTQIYILDAQLQPVPVGVAGQLYTGGDGLARHYWKRPGLTAEKFIPHPFDPKGGARLYQTGDLARYRPDGNIEFLGRIDNQIKLRGFRIEPGEIEAVLSRHPAVQQAVVTVSHRAGQSDKSLVAYIVPVPGQETAAQEIRSFLQENLPDYMIPAAFLFLEALPLNPNGKVDRQALPAPDSAFVETAVFVAPRTSLETQLAGIWAEVLDLEQVSIHDNFFHLGGHSLMATQVVSRIRRVCRVELPLARLFEAPTIAALAAELEAGSPTAVSLPIVAGERPARLPLSFAQERLWFLTGLAPDPATYHIPEAMRLHGRVDVAALAAALNIVIARHEILRTTFAVEEGRPCQIIHPPEQFSLAVDYFDLRPHPAETREAEAMALIALESRRSFNLEQGPLLRAGLFHLAENEHILLLTIHHLIADGWSMGVLVGEVAAAYAAQVAGQAPILPELPIQFADYAAWQRGEKTAESLSEQLAYWQEQLQEPRPILELPTDHRRPPVQRYRGARQRFHLSPVLTQELQALSRENGGTLFMTLLAAFKTLLYRCTGQRDVIVGTLIANRNRQEIEDLIGCFMNNLALRTSLAGDPAFRELLARVQETTLGAYAHQDLPFEQLLQALQPERDLSRTPLFQVMFVLQNAPASSLQLPELELSPLPLEHKTAYFDLRLDIWETEAGLTGSLAYNTDLFEAETAARLANHFQALLAAVVEDPAQRLSALPLLAAGERQRLLEADGRPQRFPTPACLHTLFEQQAARTPDAIALTFEESHFTYRELNYRANQLAHTLQARGVGPEVCVALCLERSLEMVISILAILKAGGAYVPLDPAYPRARQQYILADTNAPILLVQTAFLENFPETFPEYQGEVICLDSHEEQLVRATVENPSSDATPENLAYIIYTSGSTGQPKGVMITHANVLRLFSATEYHYHFNELDIWSLFHSYAFDVSVWELWGAFLYGGRLVVVPYWVSRSPEAFYDLLCRQQVTVLSQTPSAFYQLIPATTTAGAVQKLNLRYVVFGGEALALESLKPWYAHHDDGQPQLVNMYGITETTVHVTLRPLAVADVENAQGSVIGPPMQDLELYILDEHLEPSPVGVQGELYVGGDGLARGYNNRPAQTATRFIPHPFSQEPGQRLYRSGDLARRLPSGDIEYLGRSDQQVKIRGFRIELGEIESALHHHPAVRETAVLARPVEGGQQQLVAYLVPSYQTADPPADALRRFLQEKLPDYMIPAHFIALDDFPLTTNGKLDRRALPAPPATRPNLESEFVAPHSAVETALAAIWREVLGVEQVGIHDNFFVLGGHSLLATQIISRIRETLQTEMPLRSLFERPTVAGLAESLEEGAEGNTGPVLARREHGRRPPLSFSQQRLWFLDQLDPGAAAYNIPSAIRLQGRLNRAALEQSLAEVLRRHEVLRAAFSTVDGGPVQQIGPDSPPEAWLRHLDLRAELNDEEQARQMMSQDARQSFDLAAAPLLRAVLFRLADEEHILYLNMHHIICDGWSFNVLFRELSQLYPAFCQGWPSPLPELPLQYGDYAAWQREWLQSEVLQAQVAYWREQLAGAPALLKLPTRPRPAESTGEGATYRFNLPAALAGQLAALGRAEGATLFMTALAAFQVLLARYSSQSDIVVGTPIANRQRQAIEPLIGFFVNTLAVRTNLAGNPGFKELLQQVRQVTLEAYTHQDLPFEKLVDELEIARSLSHTPLFQVMCTLQESRLADLTLPGLAVSSYPIETGTTRFDLELDLIENKDGLAAAIHYNTGLFDPATIIRLAGHFQSLLASIVERPEQPIGQLPLLTPAERQQLLREWNDTQSDYPAIQTAAALFAAQAARTPQAIALTQIPEIGQTTGRLTYRELNERANQLAHYLRRLGLGPERIVGVCLPRSPEMMVALLGILKAGAAYLPLDVDYPPERMAYILQDAGTSLVITRQSLWQTGESELHLLCLDSEVEEIGRQPTTNPEPTAAPDNLAYVIYTSGSTGRPKGVMVTQHSLVHYVTAGVAHIGIQPEDRMLQFASISFDTAVEEIFSTLLAGAQLVLRSETMLASPALFWQTCAAHQITLLDLPTAYWHTLCHELDGNSLPSRLRFVFIGGEKASPEALQRWRLQAPGHIRLVNGYGPTETTIVAALCDLAGEQAPATAPLAPIGKPIANGRLYVLDQNLNPVPVGVWGQLYIGGLGLTRGYLGRPGLTAAKFIPDPFSGDRGARLYATGDVVCYLPDGNIEYQGRADDQVKIRGFRIELGEIETALSQHPEVQEVVISAVETTPGHKSLLAHYTAAQPVAEEKLRRFLQDSLPTYMVPNVFVWLAALPLTTSGKVDKNALPLPEANTVRPVVAPRSPAEETLARIWSEVLGRAEISVEDNFFGIGGDSILSIQIVSRAHQAGLRLTPRQIFQHQTIAELVQVVGTAPAVQAEQGLISGDAPLTPIQRWFFEQLLAEPHHYNQAILLEVYEPLNAALLEQAIAALLNHHDALRLRFELVEGTWRQFHSDPTADVPFTYLNLAHLPPDKTAAAVAEEAEKQQASLNLANGPLLRVVYFNFGPSRPGRLLLVIHHLVVDRVSWQILLADLEQLYRQLCERSKTTAGTSRGSTFLESWNLSQRQQLPAKTTTFKAWAERLQSYAQSELLRAELDTWLAILQGVVHGEVLPLPYDYAAGAEANSELSAVTLSAALSPADTQALLQEVPAAYKTQINDVLLAALLLAFSEWTGDEALLLDLEGHGREALFDDVDLSRTVGWFTTLFPVLLERPSPADLGETLAAVKEQLRRLPQNGLSYGLLRYLSQDSAAARDLAAIPQAEISFNYLGQFDRTLAEDSLFRVSAESSGVTIGRRNRRSHLIEINGFIRDGQLTIIWTYSTNIHTRRTIEALAQSYLAALQRLIQHCQNVEIGRLTPADFPLAGLDQAQLDKVLARFKR